MVKKTFLISVAIAGLMLSGCWTQTKGNMILALETNGTFQQCLFDQGVDPEIASACYRNSLDQQTARDCIHADYDAEQRQAYETCIYSERAREQIATHHSTCHPVLGVISCVTD